MLTLPGSPVSRIEPCRRGAGASAESAQRKAAAQQRRGLKVGSQAPRGPAQCRELEATSSRVWAGGVVVKTHSAVCDRRAMPNALLRSARRRESSDSRRQTGCGDSTPAAIAALPKHFREAALFSCRHRAPKSLQPPSGLDCNGDSRTPTRVQRARCSERAADRGLLTSVKAAR